jgi:ubiquinone/menaquinone biosynthesis C-methylase UbiE
MSLVDRIVARLLRRRHPTPFQYWENRVRTYGPRSVLHVAHAKENMEEITRMQEREIFPHFRSQLNGHEKIVLDFGCGPGRFTVQLAEMIHGEAIGLDPMRELLRRGPKNPNVNYLYVRSKTLPFADSSFDVIWCCLVMGGIAQPEETIFELCRVLRPRGLILLVENTSETPDGEFWKYRSVEQYIALFRFAKLVHLHDYIDVGERISIMAGRKSEFQNLPLIADAK